MVEVVVGHQHKVGLGQVGEGLGTADRVYVHGLAIPLHDEGGVVDGVDDENAVVGGDLVAGKPRFLGSGSSGHRRAAQEHGG